ncbi:MAG: CRISPR system precrRNA processing endoribonuclease RAMP protein Cas6 [Cloacibacillus sp.]
MIKEYILALRQESGKAPLSFEDGYPLYGMLLEMLTSDAAQSLHDEERPVLSQYLIPEERGKSALWKVTLLKEPQPELASLLENRGEFLLKSKEMRLCVRERKTVEIKNISELLDIPGTNRDASRFCLRFLSPSSYRSAGEYQIFPTVRHIIHSAALSWNYIFEDNSMDDEDAMSMLEAGVKITSYNLKSYYYPLKGNKIPAFLGTVTLNARLSAPMLQLLRAFLSLGTLRGVGIKTTLGMGGLSVKESSK